MFDWAATLFSVVKPKTQHTSTSVLGGLIDVTGCAAVFDIVGMGFSLGRLQFCQASDMGYLDAVFEFILCATMVGFIGYY
jgi:hypothetical protein